MCVSRTEGGGGVFIQVLIVLSLNLPLGKTVAFYESCLSICENHGTECNIHANAEGSEIIRLRLASFVKNINKDYVRVKNMKTKRKNSFLSIFVIKKMVT